MRKQLQMLNIHPTSAIRPHLLVYSLSHPVRDAMGLIAKLARHFVSNTVLAGAEHS
jgi:hypothetical protein